MYALLVGSGLSHAAGILTGWEITGDLIRRVAIGQGETEQADWADWYRNKVGREPDYSELGASPEERRSILEGYIEPTPEERAEGRKGPTMAHRVIADLVHRGLVRVILTTNFDRLLESALRERGVEPTIVDSIDAVQGAEPLTHARCYVIKLHGDYKDARILNTDEELANYPAEFAPGTPRCVSSRGFRKSSSNVALSAIPPPSDWHSSASSRRLPVSSCWRYRKIPARPPISSTGTSRSVSCGRPWADCREPPGIVSTSCAWPAARSLPFGHPHGPAGTPVSFVRPVEQLDFHALGRRRIMGRFDGGQ